MADRENISRRGEQSEGFKCSHCRGWVSKSEFIGTKHRNHCPTCLWSRHVDSQKAGDREASCGAGMKPVGLTFKQAGKDKYGKHRQGELMVVHRCSNDDCGKISINRIAGDDNPETILEVYRNSQGLEDDLKNEIENAGVDLLGKDDETQIRTQLFGKTF